VAERCGNWGVRPYGTVRIDAASPVEPWYDDPSGNQKRIAHTFREACKIAEGHGERLAAEGEICWGGMHSWKRMLELLEMVGRPQTSAFRPTWPIRSSTCWATMRRRTPCCRKISIGATERSSTGPTAGSRRPCGPGPSTSTSPRTTPRCTARFARQDGPPLPARRSTGQARHPRHAGYWLRDERGELTKRIRHSHVCEMSLCMLSTPGELN